MKKINLHSYHPILDIQNHVAFANNGNVVLCYQVNLPEIYSLSESDFDELHGTWFQAFKSLPIGTVIHKQDIYQKSYYTADELPKRNSKPLLKTMWQKPRQKAKSKSTKTISSLFTYVG